MSNDEKMTAYKICKEMLEQRGYDIIKDDDKNYYMEGIRENKKICVIFNKSIKIDTKSIKEIINDMNNLCINHCIVIYQNLVTPATRNILSQLNNIKIELWATEDLQYNITKHVLQPVFFRLSKDEQLEFKQKYGIKIPILKHDKPISRFFDYDKGDIIKIIRKNGYVTYRIVR